MSILALLRTEDDTVVNLIEVEEGANWSPPDGHTTVPAGNAGKGDTYDGRKFIPKPPRPQAEIDAEILSRKEAIVDTPLNMARMKADAKRTGISYREYRDGILEFLEV